MNDHELMGQFKKSLAEANVPPSLDSTQDQIQVFKFITEFQLYPSGKVFTKMYPIGKDLRSQSKRKAKKKKTEIKIAGDETY